MPPTDATLLIAAKDAGWHDYLVDLFSDCGFAANRSATIRVVRPERVTANPMCLSLYGTCSGQSMMDSSPGSTKVWSRRRFLQPFFKVLFLPYRAQRGRISVGRIVNPSETECHSVLLVRGAPC